MAGGHLTHEPHLQKLVGQTNIVPDLFPDSNTIGTNIMMSPKNYLCHNFHQNHNT